jgi:DNA-binding NarL/FixJ family response regulator
MTPNLHLQPMTHATPLQHSSAFAETTSIVPAKAAIGKPESAATGTKFGLTARELEIVSAIVDGQGNRDIALTYGISEYTVKHHLTRIFDKVGVFSRLELAMFAIHHDLNGQLRETSPKA